MSDGQWTMTAAAAGDIDGDGRGDALIGAWWGEGGARETGGVFVTDADRAVTDARDLPRRLTLDDDAHHGVGGGVTAGDIDGDGVGDVVLGGGGPGDTTADTPAVYVEYGPFAGVRTLGGGGVLWANATLDSAGGTHALAAGDLDGDGFDDLLVGTRADANDALGLAYIVLGGPRGE